MIERISELEKRLEDLEADIGEAEARLPAHSVKPPVMQVLFALEDERESLRAELRRLKTLLSDAD